MVPNSSSNLKFVYEFNEFDPRGSPGADATASARGSCKFDWFYKRIQRIVYASSELQKSLNSIGFISEIDELPSGDDIFCKSPNSIGFISELEEFPSGRGDPPNR